MISFNETLSCPEQHENPGPQETVKLSKNPSSGFTGAEKPARVIDGTLRLLPYFPCYEMTLGWYQDPELCWQVDNIDHVYTPELLKDMYTFLNDNGDCYYIEYRGVLVGDVTLRNNGEICIVICREYQNRHIGRKCVAEMLRLAKEKGFGLVKANIYSFNAQSRHMFLSAGFVRTDEEWYAYRLCPELP